MEMRAWTKLTTTLGCLTYNLQKLGYSFDINLLQLSSGSQEKMKGVNQQPLIS